VLPSQKLQPRLEDGVPTVEMYWPTEQFVISVQAPWLAVAEKPVLPSQALQPRLEEGVPTVDTYCPALQLVISVQAP
jgi:hypothetical protein